MIFNLQVKQLQANSKLSLYTFILQMDVTSQNFAELKPLIENLIKKANYFAIDLEFTGIKNQAKERDQIYYLPYQKYRKLKMIAETYQILQFGLSIVTFDNGLKVYPFNFYLFPRNSINDKTISMSLQCMIFNDDHGFDWNTWIKKGVNYIQAKDMENRTSDQIKNQQQGDYFTGITSLESVISKAIKGNESSIRVKKNKKLLRLLMNFFYKYRAENQLNLLLKSQVVKGDQDIREQYNITIKKVDLKEAMVAERDYWANYNGFGQIFKMIWESKKTIVGHNCLLDLLYSYHAFIGTLPENYFQFKKILFNSKNTFIDTKYVALNESGICGRQTKLEDLKEYFQTHHKKEIILMSFQKQFAKYNLAKLILHEAGYDSYITAWVYQQQLTLIQKIDLYNNKLNLQNSFFYVDLSSFLDIMNPHVKDMLKITWDVSNEKQFINTERRQIVKKIKQILAKSQKQYVLHEGYKQIFIEMNGIRQNVFKGLLKLKNQNQGFIKIKQIRDYYQKQIGRVQFQMNKKKESKAPRKYDKKKQSSSEKSAEEIDLQRKQTPQEWQKKSSNFKKEKKEEDCMMM